jgi:hypothetical protein
LNVARDGLLPVEFRLDLLTVRVDVRIHRDLLIQVQNLECGHSPFDDGIDGGFYRLFAVCRTESFCFGSGFRGGPLSRFRDRAAAVGPRGLALYVLSDRFEDPSIVDGIGSEIELRSEIEHVVDFADPCPPLEVLRAVLAVPEFPEIPRL